MLVAHPSFDSVPAGSETGNDSSQRSWPWRLLSSDTSPMNAVGFPTSAGGAAAGAGVYKDLRRLKPGLQRKCMALNGLPQDTFAALIRPGKNAFRIRITCSKGDKTCMPLKTGTNSRSSPFYSLGIRSLLTAKSRQGGGLNCGFQHCEGTS